MIGGNALRACARELLAAEYEAAGNKAAAFTLRQAGAVGIVLEIAVRAIEKALTRSPVEDARGELVEALEPFAKIPLCYPRRGSRQQQAKLDAPAPGGAYTAADVLRARKLLP